MIAAVLTRFGGPDAVEVREVPVPEPGSGEVLVRVAAAGMNNTDVWTREGAYGLPGDADARAGWLGPVDFPRIQGGDVVGTVAAVGSGFGEELLGRRVLLDPSRYDEHGHLTAVMGSETDGGFAEYVVAPVEFAHDVTDSPLDDAMLAALPIAYGTATGMLERGGVHSGQTVLVTGASGGVGVALVQLAAARGARVVALTSNAKRDAVAAAGADVTVDRAEGDVAELVRTAAPDGLHAVLDVVAGPVLTAVLPHLADGGRWVVSGAMGGHTVDLDLRRLYLHDISLVGSSMCTREHFARLVEDAVAGSIRPLVAARYDLADVHAAQAAFERREHVGKLVLVPPTDG